jgi:predicted phosphodiesterase
MGNEIVGQIVSEYLSKFPNTASLTLARKIFNENKEVFATIEQARNSVRYYRGSCGEYNRNKATLKFENPENKWNLPVSECDDYEPFIIPSELKSGLILCDMHIPYHDVDVCEIALEFGKEHNADFILLNGDSIDFYQLSSFMRDPRKRRVKNEIELLTQFIKSIKNNFPNAKIYYKYGNHEERLDRYLMIHAAELFDLDSMRLENILNLESLGIEHIDKRRVIKYRHLSILHGHEYKFNISNPVNPARGIFLRTHDTALAGHFHQTSEHTEKRLNEETITCWSSGCLCGLHPEYMPLNKWNHGFAIVREVEDGYWRVANKKIIDYKVV